MFRTLVSTDHEWLLIVLRLVLGLVLLPLEPRSCSAGSPALHSLAA
jgi:hypothetical protein